MLPHTLNGLLLNDEDFIKYWENIAYSNVDIKHSDDVKRFYTDVNEIEGTGIKYPLLLLVRQPVDYSGSRDAMFELYKYEFIVLKSLGTGDRKQMNKLINECKLIADEIVGKLEYDSKVFGDELPFTYFELPDLHGEAIDDPMFGDKAVGWSFKVCMGNQKRFIKSDTKWR